MKALLLMLVFVVLLTILLRDVVLILLHIESSSSSIEDWSTDVEGGVQDNGLRRLSVAASDSVLASPS